MSRSNEGTQRSKSVSKSSETPPTDERHKSELSENHLKHLDPDKFIEAYGNYGSYQIFTYIIVQTLNFFYSASIYVMSYVQLNIKKECVYNSTILLPISQQCIINTDGLQGKLAHLSNKKCGSIAGTEIRYIQQSAKTNLLIDFGYSCSHWFYQEFGLTVFTIGAIFAVPIMCWMADRFGRRPIIVFSTILAFFANVAAAFSPNYIVFLILRFIVGAASDTYLSVASVATCEYISERARAWITVVYNIAWASGMLWTLTASVITDDWRYRYLIVIAPGAYGFFLWCFLPESPHWLILHGKTEKLKKYIRISNRFNREKPDFEECRGDVHHEENHESLLVLFGSPQMLWLMFSNGFIEFVIALVYFAISFLSVELGDDHFKAFLFSSLIEIPSGLLVLPLMLNFGRRSITILSLGIQSAALLITAFVIDYYISALILMLIAKAMATIVYTTHPIWANEQFPTSVRSISFSIMNIPQSLGIIAAPYLKHINMRLPPDVSSVSSISTEPTKSSFSKMEWPKMEASNEDCPLMETDSAKSDEKSDEKKATTTTNEDEPAVKVYVRPLEVTVPADFIYKKSSEQQKTYWSTMTSRIETETTVNRWSIPPIKTVEGQPPGPEDHPTTKEGAEREGKVIGITPNYKIGEGQPKHEVNLGRTGYLPNGQGDYKVSMRHEEYKQTFIDPKVSDILPYIENKNE
ncbi:unnamed protein product [Caenorhabditis bovis]|uniref:Major facilitator superfamily (MFS) profile domain-containing protein n=1 Tax=Caenorhabditis bovis TaxID=2654633 RepID=A0A8S1ER71_9PELO|nr:unnamed protein product [Caenorhabditis bovis]